MAARYPFLWRTRAFLPLGLGLVASISAWVVARSAAVRPDSLPALTTVVTALSWWSFVTYAAALLVVVDVVRRTRAIFSLGAALSVFGCVAASVVALSLPQYLFMSEFLSRVASLETPADLATLLRVHGDYGFWRCFGEPSDLRERARVNRPVIARDFARYGLTTDFSVTDQLVPNCPDPYGATHGLVVKRTDSQDFITAEIFEQRLRNIEASQQYVQGELGAYQGTVLGRIWTVVSVAALSGLAAAIGLRTMLQRKRAWSVARRVLTVWRYHPSVMSRFDRWLAANWPSLWSSKIHVSGLPLLASTCLVMLLAGRNQMTWWGTYVAVPALVGTLFWTLRVQERVRHLPMRLSEEICVLLVHLGIVGLLVAALISLSVRPVRGAENLAAFLWCGVWFCAALQAARNTSALAAYGGVIVGAVLLATCAWVTTLVLNTWVSAPEEAGIILGTGGLVLCFILLARFVLRIDGRLNLRRLLVSALLSVSPFPAITLTIGLLAPRPADLTATTLGFSIALSVANVALCLRVTQDARRILAQSVR